jgi:FMN-dependent NADH-azoreductase
MSEFTTMTTVLALRSSILGTASASNHLIDETIVSLRAEDATLRFIDRDLGSHPVPHLDGDGANALRADPANASQQAARALSDLLIDELQSADILLIGAPMYNFGISSMLKSWFDHVLRAGVTFRYSDTGPEGLLAGKRAIVILTRGGHYSDGPARTMDAQEPHLRTLLSFVGITDQTFVRAEKLAFGPAERETALGQAKDALGRAVRVGVPQVA